MEPDLTLSILSAALLVLAGVAFVRQRRVILAITAALFFPLCGTSLLCSWWLISPILALVFLILTLGVSLVTIVLFLIDVIWAPFGLEMTYLTFLCWILCPLAVVLAGVGSLI